MTNPTPAARPLAALALLLSLSACTQTADPTPPPAQGSSGSLITPSTFRLPEGAGCSGDVARFRAVIVNDLETGHVAKSVHDRIMPEIDRAGAVCAAGRDGEARALIAATKSRFGYP
jgi:hypothetical protein